MTGRPLKIFRLIIKPVLILLVMCLAACMDASGQHLPARRTIEAGRDSTERVLLTDSLSAAIPEAVADVVKEGADSMFIDLTPRIVKAKQSKYDVWEPRQSEFNPDPTRAVWLAALFPGLGQVYNRRYWKLPIIIGGYMGLAYATTWNNNMLTDYTRAYRDIMDNDPGTNSYMNFFPPTTQEGDLDKTWLTNLLQSRKNYFRRNRDLCIIAMVGVYLLAMVDAYVDASLSHFDITPELSMDVSPALFQECRGMKPGIGLQWAINF